MALAAPGLHLLDCLLQGVPSERSSRAADRGRPQDGGREDDPDGSAGRCAPPGTLAGGCLVLVLVDLAAGVLGNDRRIVGNRPGPLCARP
jgi:hypothetical protein